MNDITGKVIFKIEDSYKRPNKNICQDICTLLLTINEDLDLIESLADEIFNLFRRVYVLLIY